MKILRKITAAFMLYSKIPMPASDPDADDIKGAIMFLPLVGIVIAALMYPVIRILSVTDIPVFVRTIAVILVPIVVTGGFHIDGFMDTTDALRSYRQKERKLEIMSDPHTGSFAVIGLVTVIMFMAAGLGVILYRDAGSGMILNVCGIFVISRGCAALTSIYIRKAKPDGLLVSETANAGNMHSVVIIIQMAAVLAVMAIADAAASRIIMMAFVIFTAGYRHMVIKNFGGVTGDTAGYYVTVSEAFAVCVLAVSRLILG